jgi:HEAT repeat protein
MKIKLTLTPAAAAIVQRMFDEGELADVGVVGITELDESQSQAISNLTGGGSIEVIPEKRPENKDPPLGDEYSIVPKFAAAAADVLGAKTATPEVLAKLIRLVGGENIAVRSLAVLTFRRLRAEITDEVLDGLLQLLSEETRAAPKPEVLGGLVRLLVHPDSMPDPDSKVIFALRELFAEPVKPEALAGLIQLLGDEDSSLRWAAATAVNYLGWRAATPEVLGGLARLLDDKEPRVRATAFETVIDLHYTIGQAAAIPEVIAVLVKHLHSGEPVLRETAAELLRLSMGEEFLAKELEKPS